MEAAVPSSRNELFQELKPRCVELSQLALRDDGSSITAKSLIESTKKLHDVLNRKCRRDDGAFDEKLADYVFFPLSQILRKKQQYNDSLSELTIRCLRILLEYGWRRIIALDLGKQLLILLTFAAGGVPGQPSEHIPDELIIEAYGALSALFRDLGVTPGGAASLVESGSLPALGHCVTIILDGVKDGPSANAQIHALQALAGIWCHIKDQQALSSFLPGTVSALTKCLMPSTANRRSGKTIVSALDVLEHVLTSILSDIHTRNIRSGINTTVASSNSKGEQKPLTKPWLTATTGQIKLALSNIIRLRNHESVDVRRGLNKLCLTVLDECHDTLSEASKMLVETCMTLADVDEYNVNRTTSLIDLATIHSDLQDMIQDTTYNWITGLSRVMQSNDETAKHAALGQLSKAHVLLTSLGLGSSILEGAFVTSLRDSVTVTLELLNPARTLQEEEFDLNSQAAMMLTTENALVSSFRPIIMAQESQKGTRNDFVSLLEGFDNRETQIRMASEMLQYVHGASGPGLLAAYWLSSRLLHAATVKNKDLDEFFTSSLTLSEEQAVVNEELFSYSLSLLSTSEDDSTDWRLQAIALEVMANTAQKMKAGFRTELVDTLYPIAQLLGSPDPNLRQHAITCLNIVSRECGYANASDLIIGNVDYMVNAISLRLNTFDISPQAPQVLVMMMRLTGPSLLPYLDDVVSSIFAALDNFHGYHRLVEILFSVLGEIVDVGSKSGQLQIAGIRDIEHRKKMPIAFDMFEIIDTVETKSAEKLAKSNAKFPEKAWKDAKALLDEAEATEANPDKDDEPDETAKPPPTKVYTMVQSIARLGQHYLTNQSPILRAKLLGLVGTACRALHSNEEQFLPLVNDIWPVVVKRLYDDEPYVAIAAADAIAEICRCAGDFMATRIQADWIELMEMARQAKKTVSSEKKGSGGRGPFSQASQVWEAVVRLLVTVVENVRIDDEMFDDIFDLFKDLILNREDIREALTLVNADLVWLANAQNYEGIERPMLGGFHFAMIS